LTKLTEEKQAFQWTLEAVAAFLFLLTHSQERFIVDTDVSNIGIG
jgi:hypothetical protein